MNSVAQIPPQNAAAPHRVEFFRLPQPGKRDPFFGLSRGWYYKAEAAGEIRMVAIRNRGAARGVRLVAYDSVMECIRRAMGEGAAPKPACQGAPPALTAELPVFAASSNAGA